MSPVLLDVLPEGHRGFVKPVLPPLFAAVAQEVAEAAVVQVIGHAEQDPPVELEEARVLLQELPGAIQELQEDGGQLVVGASGAVLPVTRTELEGVPVHKGKGHTNVLVSAFQWHRLVCSPPLCDGSVR